MEENAGATSVSGVSIALLAIEAEFLGLSGTELGNMRILKTKYSLDAN